MRKWIKQYRLFMIKLGMILFLLILYVIFSGVSAAFSDRTHQSVHLTLQFPLPSAIVHRYSYPIAGLIPEKVILAGFFSDWNPSDNDYRMRQSETNVFDFDLKLKPGKHQYKYVLYYPGNSTPIWVEDWKNPHKAKDQFGGFNSVVSVYSPFVFLSWARSLILGILILMVLYTLLIPILRKIYLLKISFRIKMAVSTILIILFQSVFLYFFQIHQKMNLLHTFFIEPVQIIHHVLESEGIDFLHPEKQKQKIKAILKKLVWFNKAKIESPYDSSDQSYISGIILYNKKFIPIVAMNRQENEVIQENQMKQRNISDLETYLDREFFRGVIQKTKQHPLQDKIIPVKATPKFMKTQGFYFKNLISWFPYKGYLIPIFEKHRIAGYYGVVIHPYVFARKLRSQFFLYLSFLIVTLILAFLLSLDQGSLVTRQLLRLKKWTDSIKEGKFDRSEKIVTGDEIQELATNFDQMRITLKDSLKNERERLEELEELKIHLEDMVQDRTEELTTAAEKLKYRDINIQNELNFAAAIQRGIMPSQEFSWNDDFYFYSYSEPLQKIGGDFLDIIETRDGNLSFYMADVSGHGIPSAFITALLKSSVISILQEKSDPVRVMQNLNTRMQVINSPEQTSVYSHYLTMLYLKLRKDGSFDYTNCAHPKMFLYRNKDQNFDTLEAASGTVVGILDPELFRVKEKSAHLNEGDMLFLYTDGLIEQRNDVGEELEYEGLKNIILSGIQQGHDGITLLNTISSGIRKYAENVLPKDDMSLLILKRRTR